MVLGTEAEASHHLGSTAEAGWGLCGGLSLGGMKCTQERLIGWGHQSGSPHSKDAPELKCSCHRKWEFVAKGQGGANGREMEARAMD